MSASTDRITRARELGLPTNSDEAVGNSHEAFCYAEGDEGSTYCGAPKRMHCAVLGNAVFWSSAEGQKHLVKCMKDDHFIHHPFNEDKPPLTTGLDSQRQGVESRLGAEDVILREAILGVIDGGCDCYSEKHPWEFHEDQIRSGNDPFTEDMANQQRLRFADAVIARARKIKEAD